MNPIELANAKEAAGKFGVVTGIFFCAITLVILSMWGCPHYQVYEQRLSGEAELAKATYNRQVRVREAEATKEASSLLAEAEVIKAGGIANANKIVGDSLKGHEEYLRWLYIEGLRENKGASVVYIPTEAGIPILEAKTKGAK